MKKSDLVAEISERAGLSKADAERAVEGIFASITAALKDGGGVRLTGFGTFSVTSRAAREGRDPRNGVVVGIPARRVAKFSAGKALKDAING